MRVLLLVFCNFLLSLSLNAQTDRWQQRIQYNINVNLNVETNILSGTEQIVYFNNSPDTLDRLFFHTYWNAFQPNSGMDIRSQELGKVKRKDRKGNEFPEWDGRVKDRIGKLKPTEIGYQTIKKLTINGVAQTIIGHETITEIKLSKPILPRSKVQLSLVFEAQVPIQIRRSGRNNAEGVQFSMSQWYPKMVEYDLQGWNANPYIAREFYGVWGDFDVSITLDKRYIVAGTGVLQNANEIGYGYQNSNFPQPLHTKSTLTWRFKGNNIHDFVWAADTAYKHISKKVNNIDLHVFYLPKNASADSAWNNVLWAAEKVLPYMEKQYGKYPYPQYSFIQGGDGGMEYAMATLLKGPGIGTVIHEWMHSWYQHILATNESLFAWMDEGFTSYAENEVSAYYNLNWGSQSPWISNAEKNEIKETNLELSENLPYSQADIYNAYFALVKSGWEEPLTTHADHFNTNFAYSLASYSKGAVFLEQLGYIVGKENLHKILLRYYDEWKFKHPTANDFIRIAEKVSGIQLQWYKEYWIYTTKTIDYGIGNIEWDTAQQKTKIILNRIGKMPMPIDVKITYKNGTEEMYYIPLNLMLNTKPVEANSTTFVKPEWLWTHPNYDLYISKPVNTIKSVEIDPSKRMADINSFNNKLVVPD